MKSMVHRVRRLTVQVTRYCNLRCGYCYCRPLAPSLQDGIPFPPLREFLIRARRLGVDHVVLTGGEPLAYPNIGDLLDFLVDAKFNLVLETNGSLARESLFERLSGITSHVAVTLDGAKPETHNKIRGSVKSWNHAVQALRVAHQFPDVTTQITFNISKRSKSEITDVFELGRELGVNRIKMNPVFCIKPHEVGDASDFYCDPTEFIEVAERFADASRGKYPFEVHFALPPALLPESIRFEPRQCHCCRVNHVLGVLCDGSIRPCHGFLDHDTFQLGHLSAPYDLEEVFRLLDALPGVDPRRLKGVCARCALAPFCGGYCRAQACYDFDDPLASNPLCQNIFEAGNFPSDLLLENLVGGLRYTATEP